MHRIAFVLVIACGASTPESATPQHNATTEIAADPRPIATVALRETVQSQHFLTLPVRVNDQDTIAILDTGIGLALISQAMCERIGCEVTGEFTGRRMSGQAVTIPTTTVPMLEVGGVQRTDIPAGVVNIPGFFPDERIEAFVGLPFFEETPFTLDLANNTLVIESRESREVRSETAIALPVHLDRQGIALDVFAPATLSDGTELNVLVDTGSRGVTLHTRYAQPLAIDLEGEDIDRREGQDETGHTYTRYFTTLPSLAFKGSGQAEGLRVMFQEIIHDGLVGTEFLSNYVVTFDIPESRLLIARP